MPDHRLVFTYDDAGKRRVKQEQFDADGKLMFYMNFVYDQDNRRHKIHWHNPNGSAIRSYVLKYNKVGAMVSSESYDRFGKREWRIITPANSEGDTYLILNKNSISFFNYFQRDLNGNWLKAFRLQFGVRRWSKFLIYPFLRIFLIERTINTL